LWFLPSAFVTPARKWTASLYRINTDDGQGFSDISNFPVTFGVGLANRAEIFGAFTALTRIDRDTYPVFFPSSSTAQDQGTGGGILVNHPGVHQHWIGNKRGDFSIGAKINFLPAKSSAGFAIRVQAKLPTGDKASGASSGKTDVIVDAIASARLQDAIEISGS